MHKMCLAKCTLNIIYPEQKQRVWLFRAWRYRAQLLAALSPCAASCPSPGVSRPRQCPARLRSPCLGSGQQLRRATRVQGAARPEACGTCSITSGLGTARSPASSKYRGPCRHEKAARSSSDDTFAAKKRI